MIRYFTFFAYGVADLPYISRQILKVSAYPNKHTPYLAWRKSHCSLATFWLDWPEEPIVHRAAYQPHERGVCVQESDILGEIPKDSLTRMKLAGFGPLIR